MSCYCVKCQTISDEKNFYQTNNKEQFPNGYVDMCKKCLTSHVDNWEPETYLWILEKCDVPYVPEEWNKLLIKFGDGASSAAVVGRYLAKMRLKKWKTYRWKDNALLESIRKKEIEESMKSAGYSQSDINAELLKGRVDVPEKPKPPQVPEPTPAPALTPTAEPAPALENNNSNVAQAPVPFAQQAQPEIDLGLTQEDITYLSLKWGTSYRQEEWVKLEQLHEDMKNSFDIQNAGHEDTLKLICKASLKCHQLVDLGDVEGFQKMSKVYDSLMRSGNFTAVQNKNEDMGGIDSISEIVAICEQEGYIPRFYSEQPNDKVDITIRDMQRYARELVSNENRIEIMIEEAIKRIEKEQKMSQDETSGEDDDFKYEEEKEIKPLQYEDYEEFNHFKDSLRNEGDEN